MKTPLSKVISAVAALTVSCFASSSEALELSVVGNLNLSNYAIVPALSTSSSLGYGGGGLLGLDLFPFISFETGALFLTHSINPNPLSTLSLSYIQVPALVRFNPLPFLSFGAGAYYGLNMSSTLNGPAVPELTSGQLRNDFGLLGSAGVRLPLAPFTRLRVDLMYEFGLIDISSGTSSQSSRNLNLFAGLLFDLG